MQFSADVSSSLGLNDLILTNLTTGTDISPAAMSLSYSSATNRATVIFTGLPGQKLPDGRYKLTVLKAGVTDSNGNQLIADFSSNFHVLTGDANGDGFVDTSDFNVLAANFSKTVTPQENSGSISLQAGQKYDIKLEYYNHNGLASAKLLWSSASQINAVVPYEVSGKTSTTLSTEVSGARTDPQKLTVEPAAPGMAGALVMVSEL